MACEGFHTGCTCGDCQKRYLLEHANSCTYAGGTGLTACFCDTVYRGVTCPKCGRCNLPRKR